MKHIHLISTGMLLLITVIACGGSAPLTQPAPESPTSTESAPTALPAATNTSAPTSESTAATEAPTSDATAQVSFANNVYPILEARCIKCHGVETKKEGLDLRTYDDIMAGSRNGSVLTPGNAADSLMVQLIERGKMPNRGPKLTPEEAQIIKDWINQGALNN